jgi:hypothetical protein
MFSFGAQPPTESNIIVFDNFVTISDAMIPIKNLLEYLGKKRRSHKSLSHPEKS